MRQLSPNGLALIQHFEGFRGKIYRDAAGLQTIGYGHLLKASEAEQWREGTDGDSALALLRMDVKVAEQAVRRFITAPLTQNQFDALTSFTFNLGAALLQRSTLRQIVNRGEIEAVPYQLLRYVWAGGRKQSGLVRRRQAEADLYLKP